MTTLKTTTEATGKDQVKLRVEVPEGDLDPAVGAVYKRWAQEIKVPGFRKGKVPRRLIDQRVGVDVIREEALRDALPGLYREALSEAALEAIAPPEIEVTQWEPGSPLVFEATVDLRPAVELPDLSNIKVDAPDATATENEIDEQIERLRDRFAELEPVGRPAARGDHVLIDVKGTHQGEPVEGTSAPDLLYEIGSGGGPPSLDGQLEGERPGAILSFTDEVLIPGSQAAGPVTFTVILKEVKAKKLPGLDDEFAKTVGEFDSLDELKEDLRAKISEYKASLIPQEVRNRALRALVDASDLTPPEKLVDSEVKHRLEHIEADLQRAGLSLAQYAESSNLTELDLRADIRAEAARSVKAELLLEEIARRAEVEVTEEDIGTELAIAAARSQVDAKELAERVVKEGRLSAVAADVIRRKAMDHLLGSVIVIGLPEDLQEGEDGGEETAVVDDGPSGADT